MYCLLLQMSCLFFFSFYSVLTCARSAGCRHLARLASDVRGGRGEAGGGGERPGPVGRPAMITFLTNGSFMLAFVANNYIVWLSNNSWQLAMRLTARQQAAGTVTPPAIRHDIYQALHWTLFQIIWKPMYKSNKFFTWTAAWQGWCSI